ncbi:MAG: AraC family transcriptional regulator [Candidatus Kapabacteria bacterium]|nr:AraC family transcriptional regulator [Candidatus Kapabacteria bacterium]
MTPTEVQLDAMHIRGLARTFNMSTRHNIPQLWADAVPLLHTMPGRVPTATYGTCIDMFAGEDGDAGFVYMAGVEVDPEAPSPEGLTTVVAPAGKYAMFTFDEHISKFPEFIDAVWSKYFPASGYTKRKALDFERYDERWNPVTGSGPVDYYIPID